MNGPVKTKREGKAKQKAKCCKLFRCWEVLGHGGVGAGPVQGAWAPKGMYRIPESLNHVFGVRTLKRKGGSGFETVDEGL